MPPSPLLPFDPLHLGQSGILQRAALGLLAFGESRSGARRPVRPIASGRNAPALSEPPPPARLIASFPVIITQFCRGFVNGLPEITPCDAGPGALIRFRMKPRAISKHVGIPTTPDTFPHAHERLGVIEEPLTPSWRRRIGSAFLSPWGRDPHAACLRERARQPRGRASRPASRPSSVASRSRKTGASRLTLARIVNLYSRRSQFCLIESQNTFTCAGAERSIRPDRRRWRA